MMIVHIFLIIFISSSVNNLVEGLSATNVRCKGVKMHQLSVSGCNQQPCTIRKGQRLPFDLTFSVTTPGVTASNVHLRSSISYYAVPPSYYGSDLIYAACDNGKLGFQCPVISNKQYKLRNSIYIDPKARCTAGCTGMKKDGTGMRDTTWTLTMTKNRQTSSPAYFCSFNIKMNIVA